MAVGDIADSKVRPSEVWAALSPQKATDSGYGLELRMETALTSRPRCISLNCLNAKVVAAETRGYSADQQQLKKVFHRSPE
jgi:hypothetical protein